MQSYRPAFHMSVPDNWKNDPQRPIYVDGEYLYYYLYDADYTAGEVGTAWRLATTRDHVSFKDQGVAIPKHTNGNGDCWSGCLVVDEEDTAGYGRGAVIALVTQAPQNRQAQYLWYSTDRGRTFQPGGTDPVLPNPDRQDFRDPKVIWDEERSRWFMAIAEGQRLGFYTSPDLRHWEPVGEFVREDLGVLECPDIFRMEAGDGSTRWVLGASANGKGRGLPATYAYWTGEFDGATFTPSAAEPQWLDRGFDFYGAVTYPHHRADGRGGPDAASRDRLGELLGLPAQHADHGDRRLQRRRHDRSGRAPQARLLRHLLPRLPAHGRAGRPRHAHPPPRRRDGGWHARPRRGREGLRADLRADLGSGAPAGQRRVRGAPSSPRAGGTWPSAHTWTAATPS